MGTFGGKTLGISPMTSLSRAMRCNDYEMSMFSFISSQNIAYYGEHEMFKRFRADAETQPSEK